MLGLPCRTCFSPVVARGHRNSSCDAQTSHWSGFFCFRAWTHRTHGLQYLWFMSLEHSFSSWGEWAQLLYSMWNLPKTKDWTHYLLPWQADSSPLSHQGSPCFLFITLFLTILSDACWLFSCQVQEILLKHEKQKKINKSDLGNRRNIPVFQRNTFPW